MSYYIDLTPHTYTELAPGQTVLNIGWLDAAYPFPRGETSPEFRAALLKLCAEPVRLHRGLHYCQFCPGAGREFPDDPEQRGNGQIRIQSASGIWYAAPTLVYHYVARHDYLPPAEFIETVIHPSAVEEGT